MEPFLTQERQIRASQVMLVLKNPAGFYAGDVFIRFRIDWFDFLAVQKTLKSLLQHRSSKALILVSYRLLDFIGDTL